VALALGARYLRTRENFLVETVTQLLPGANCGACGFAGCAGYASAIVAGKAPPNRCPSCAAESLAKISAALGIAPIEASERKVAIVLCRGDNDQANKRFTYDGITDCAAAAAVGGGDKACRYGCLGYGTCVRVCPAHAIEVVNGVARVHPDLCISCGQCVAACPRGIIRMVPQSRRIHVFCSSKDPGAEVRKVCKVGCIGCRICTRLAAGAITMDGTLAVVNDDLPLENEEVVAKCPGKCILKV
jgi:Na+-translocating ferredoxin:NAD+ oxidoreductase subunit B